MSRQADPSCDTIRAVVQRVLDSYVVAYPMEDYGDLTKGDSITFSRDQWEGRDDPQPRQVVELEGTTLYVSGWRATKASPVVPTIRKRDSEKERISV